MGLPYILRRKSVGVSKRVTRNDNRLLPRSVRFTEEPSSNSTQLVQRFCPVTFAYACECVGIRHAMKHLQVGWIRHPQLSKSTGFLRSRGSILSVAGMPKMLEESWSKRSSHVCNERPVPCFRNRQNCWVITGVSVRDTPWSPFATHPHER